MSKLPPTEQSGKYDGLHQMSVGQLVSAMNSVDAEALDAVSNCLSQIESFVEQLVLRMSIGGRLFYVGAGTSGRLGVVDASECPPTFGVDHGRVVGLIAGGDSAIRKAVEGAEDSETQGWDDLLSNDIGENDTVVGIAASGRTPYVVGALKRARLNGILTSCVTCNPNTAVTEHSDYPIEAITGPEFVAGSTRLKAGTATKLVLNMITTITMIKLGHVKGNRMVDMQLSNDKLVERGIRMVVEAIGVRAEKAEELLLKHGSVRNAIKAHQG
ncbi:MAG: N-acetylmuramic acid 6-phosphate etherase [Crocinitomicaceae bacterium]|nr:N-acetylmuramic acid 6-phosphate etherase [Crocinitomicaceae bacterium]|tara:strand:+ start:2193 stop:3005 length:813 start_codon:yes stop_codon:yes gene_type:complete